jgi:hypothetical protein
MVFVGYVRIWRAGGRLCGRGADPGAAADDQRGARVSGAFRQLGRLTI